MNKLIATIFFCVLAVGSMYGCVVDDGYRGDGRRGVEMEHRGDGHADRMERNDNEREDRRHQRDDHGEQRRGDN